MWFPRRCSGTIQHLSRANTSGHSQNTINITVDSKCTCPSINFDSACLKTRLCRTTLQGDMFHFVDDSHPRDARHSQSVMTEELQKVRVKFVLQFPTCVSKTKTINLCRHQKCQALKSHPQSAAPVVTVVVVPVPFRVSDVNSAMQRWMSGVVMEEKCDARRQTEETVTRRQRDRDTPNDDCDDQSSRERQVQRQRQKRRHRRQ